MRRDREQQYQGRFEEEQERLEEAVRVEEQVGAGCVSASVDETAAKGAYKGRPKGGGRGGFRVVSGVLSHTRAHRAHDSDPPPPPPRQPRAGGRV